ncbi:hypothetical protein OIV83_004785 [Microbotryomycetes sp. JL201]|nr:hypothetical protein OIV83_004785 [Microbotryomycetes sp. JL201]
MPLSATKTHEPTLITDDNVSRLSEQLPAYTSHPTLTYDTWNFADDKQDISLIVYGKDGLKAWFSHDCEIREERSQKILYHLSGSYKLVGMDLKLTKRDNDGKLIGQVKKGFLGGMRLNITMADGWQTKLVRSHLFSTSFSFESPDGSVFKWKSRLKLSGSIKLIKTSKHDSARDADLEDDQDEEDTGKVVAEWKETLTLSSKALRLTIRQQYAHLTDLFLTTVLGWEALAVEEYRRTTAAGGDNSHT